MKKVLSVFLACAMILCVCAACGSSNGGSGSDRGVNIYVEGTMPSLDPITCAEYSSCYVFNNIYETLIRIDEKGEIVPWLATEWTASDDGITYSFTLKKGVKFHNGEEMKASDVVFSLNAAIAEPIMSNVCSHMDHAVATGDYTFDLVLKDSYAAIITMLQNLYIVNEKFYTAQESNYDVACGTGAYKLREGAVDLNTEVTVDRFDDYHLGKPAIPYATFKIITDASTARIQLESGELDFMMVYSVSNYAPLVATGNYNSALAQAPHTAYIALNLEVEPLDNKALRQALNYAADKDSIIQIAYEGLAKPARALTGENSFGVDFSDCMDFSYNPEKAKEKLAEAGFPNGLNFDDYGVVLEYIPGSYHEKIANCLQETWGQVGIQISLRATENVDCAAGAHTMRTTGCEYKSDISYIANKYGSDFIGSSNYAFYRNDRVDEIIAEAGSMTDQDARAALYKEMCEIIVEDAPYVPIQHKQIPYVWAKDLTANVYPSNECPYYVYEWHWN